MFMLNTATLVAIFATLATVHAGTFHLLQVNVKYREYERACIEAGMQVAHLNKHNTEQALNAVQNFDAPLNAEENEKFDTAWIQSHPDWRDKYLIIDLKGEPRIGSVEHRYDRDRIDGMPLCYYVQEDEDAQDEKIALESEWDNVKEVNSSATDDDTQEDE
jgi:hypothetical protein